MSFGAALSRAGRVRRFTATAVFAAALLFGAPRASQAQTPADTAAVLLEVAQGLEREGRMQLAGALYNLIIERYPGSAAAQEVLRRRGTAALPRTEMDRGGRAELIVFGTTYGLWLGVALPASFGSEEASLYGLTLLAGGPAGFLIAKNYADKSLRGEGHARLISGGGTWGTWQAFGWTEVLDIGASTRRETVCVEYTPDFRDCVRTESLEYEDGPDAETYFRAMLLGGITGIVLGDQIGRRAPITPGMATSASLGGLWGSWFGFATNYIIDEDVDGVDGNGDGNLAWTLIGGNLGVVGGALFARKAGWTREQARLISIAGVAGGVGGLGLILLIQPDDERIGMGLPLAGSVAGLIAGTRWVRGRANAAQEPGGEEALLQVEDGKWAMSVPMPQPAMLRDARGERVPALAVPIFKARF